MSVFSRILFVINDKFEKLGAFHTAGVSYLQTHKKRTYLTKIYQLTTTP